MILDNYKKEVEELHRFFVSWYTGALKNSDDQFCRFKDVMDDGVHFVGPDGSIADRNDLFNWIRESWASYSKGEFGIKIKNLKLLHETKESGLVTYEEWQNIKGKTVILISTVMLRKTENAYNDLEWSHIHVTERKL